MAKETKKTAAAADTEEKQNEAPLGSAENPMHMVEAAAPAGAVGAFGQALTPEQLAGLEPIDRAKDNEEAAHRDEMPNRQTTHELDAGLDPISGGPTPGVTTAAPLTAVGAGAPPSDMSGRPAVDANVTDADRKAAAGEQAKAAENRKAGTGKKVILTEKDRAQIRMVRDGLTKAKQDDMDKGKDENRIGWRTPADLGVSGATMAKLYDSGDYPLEMETMPNGHFFPETGRRYRVR